MSVLEAVFAKAEIREGDGRSLPCARSSTVVTGGATACVVD